jgi:hypothetical protein
MIISSNSLWIKIFSKKNWRKIAYFNDFIAIDRTINRPENRDKIIHFYGILTIWIV